MNELSKALLELLRPYLVDVIMESFSSVLAQQDTDCHFPEKINVTQASELTGYSKNSLYQMHSKGQIPGALKVGGKLLFDTETLRNWVNAGGKR
jgi:predicted DNA-binding transcriptional regulator AlpA